VRSLLLKAEWEQSARSSVAPPKDASKQSSASFFQRALSLSSWRTACLLADPRYPAEATADLLSAIRAMDVLNTQAWIRLVKPDRSAVCSRSEDESAAPQITTAEDWHVGSRPGPGTIPPKLRAASQTIAQCGYHLAWTDCVGAQRSRATLGSSHSAHSSQEPPNARN